VDRFRLTCAGRPDDEQRGSGGQHHRDERRGGGGHDRQVGGRVDGAATRSRGRHLACRRERLDAGASIEEATAQSLAHTGRIVTTAAALLAVSFFAFVTSGVSFLQLFGLGSGLAINHGVRAQALRVAELAEQRRRRSIRTRPRSWRCGSTGEKLPSS